MAKENCIVRRVILCNPHQILLRVPYLRERDGSACGSHRAEENSKYGFSMVPYTEQGRDHLEDLGIDVGVILQWILMK
jgi:hypothetical protein